MSYGIHFSTLFKQHADIIGFPGHGGKMQSSCTIIINRMNICIFAQNQIEQIIRTVKSSKHKRRYFCL